MPSSYRARSGIEGLQDQPVRYVRTLVRGQVRGIVQNVHPCITDGGDDRGGVLRWRRRIVSAGEHRGGRTDPGQSGRRSISSIAAHEPAYPVAGVAAIIARNSAVVSGARPPTPA
jgi:hypothetical protein